MGPAVEVYVLVVKFSYRFFRHNKRIGRDSLI